MTKHQHQDANGQQHLPTLATAAERFPNIAGELAGVERLRSVIQTSTAAMVAADRVAAEYRAGEVDNAWQTHLRSLAGFLEQWILTLCPELAHQPGGLAKIRSAISTAAILVVAIDRAVPEFVELLDVLHEHTQ